jgi:hypothetical protein
LLRGRLVHDDIRKSPSLEHESSAGWIVHYVTGGTVALMYAVLYLAVGGALPGSHMISGVLWGLVTAVFPWLILYPAFGWGLFGSASPEGTRPLLSPALSHSLYGLGLGIVLSLAARLTDSAW